MYERDPRNVLGQQVIYHHALIRVRSGTKLIWNCLHEQLLQTSVAVQSDGAAAFLPHEDVRFALAGVAAFSHSPPFVPFSRMTENERGDLSATNPTVWSHILCLSVSLSLWGRGGGGGAGGGSPEPQMCPTSRSNYESHTFLSSFCVGWALN